MVLARLGPRTATMTTASTRLGVAMMTSISRVTITSISEPAIAAASPSATPMTTAKAMTATPMNSEMRAPKMTRDRRSRPSPSVPSGKRQLPPAQTGLARTNSRNCSIGECGAMTSAASAASTMSASTQARSSRRDFRRRRRRRRPAARAARAPQRLPLAPPSPRQRAWRIRGLMIPYRRSTIRLTRMTAPEMSSTPPCKAG